MRELAERSGQTDSKKDDAYLRVFCETSDKCFKVMASTGYKRRDIFGFLSIVESHQKRMPETLFNLRLFLGDLLIGLENNVAISECTAKVESIRVDVQCSKALCAFVPPDTTNPEDDEGGSKASAKAMVQIVESIAEVKRLTQDLDTLLGTATDAIEVHRLFQSPPTDFQKAIALFVRMDKSKALLDELSLTAYRSFSNRFSCADVAQKKYDECRVSLVASGTKLISAVTGTDDQELARASQYTKAFVSDIHQMNQLVAWSATGYDDTNNLGVATDVANSLKHFRVVEKAKEVMEFEGTLDEFLERVQVTMGENYKHVSTAMYKVHNLGRDVAVAKLVWIFGEGSPADCVWNWIESGTERMKGVAEAVNRRCRLGLEPTTSKLQTAMKEFTHTSTEKKAGLVKTAQGQVEPMLNLAAAVLGDMGLDNAVLKEARQTVDDSTLRTVHWGLHQLSSSAEADHIKQGAMIRKHIVTIMDSYNEAFLKLPEELRNRCQKLAAMGGGDGTAEEPEPVDASAAAPKPATHDGDDNEGTRQGEDGQERDADDADPDLEPLAKRMRRIDPEWKAPAPRRSARVEAQAKAKPKAKSNGQGPQGGGAPRGRGGQRRATRGTA